MRTTARRYTSKVAAANVVACASCGLWSGAREAAPLGNAGFHRVSWCAMQHRSTATHELQMRAWWWRRPRVLGRLGRSATKLNLLHHCLLLVAPCCDLLAHHWPPPPSAAAAASGLSRNQSPLAAPHTPPQSPSACVSVPCTRLEACAARPLHRRINSQTMCKGSTQLPHESWSAHRLACKMHI